MSTGQFELLILVAALVGLAYAGLQTALVLREDEGNERMREISAAIREGAIAFLRREYTFVFAVAAVLAIIIAFAFGITGDGGRLAVGSSLASEEARWPGPWGWSSASGRTSGPRRMR